MGLIVDWGFVGVCWGLSVGVINLLYVAVSAIRIFRLSGVRIFRRSSDRDVPFVCWLVVGLINNGLGLIQIQNIFIVQRAHQRIHFKEMGELLSRYKTTFFIHRIQQDLY